VLEDDGLRPLEAGQYELVPMALTELGLVAVLGLAVEGHHVDVDGVRLLAARRDGEAQGAHARAALVSRVSGSRVRVPIRLTLFTA
jgi:hypothetical protein